MLTNAKIDELFGIKESYQAPNVLMKVLFDKRKREELFKKFLEHEVNLDNDWFHIYFEEEHSNKNKLNEAARFTANASIGLRVSDAPILPPVIAVLKLTTRLMFDL